MASLSSLSGGDVGPMSSRILTRGLRRVTNCSCGDGLASKVPALEETTEEVMVEATEEASEAASERTGVVMEDSEREGDGLGLKGSLGAMSWYKSDGKLGVL
jgi:hypothetical protein